MAGMYERGAATAVSMRLLDTSTGDFGNLHYVVYNPGGPSNWVFGPYSEYDAGAGAGNMYYAVGFTSELNDNNQSGFAIATIGLANPGLSDIYDGFELPIANDNDDEWRYQAYVTAEAGTAYSTVTGIGLELQWDRLLNEGASGDDYNVSVVPVPGTLLLVMLGLVATGVTGVKLRRFA